MRRAFVALAIAVAVGAVSFAVRATIKPAPPPATPVTPDYVGARDLATRLGAAIRATIDAIPQRSPGVPADGMIEGEAKALTDHQADLYFLRQDFDNLDSACGVSARDMPVFESLAGDAARLLALGAVWSRFLMREKLDILLLELSGRPDAALEAVSSLRVDTDCGTCNAPLRMMIDLQRSGVLQRQGRILEALSALDKAAETRAHSDCDLAPAFYARREHLHALATRSTWPPDGDQRLVDLYPGTMDGDAARSRLTAAGLLQAPTAERLKRFFNTIDEADAIRAFARHRFGESYEILTGLLRATLRFETAVIDALGELGDRRAVDVLLARLPATDESRDFSTTRALYRLGETEVLVPFLKRFRAAEPGDGARVEALVMAALPAHERPFAYGGRWHEMAVDDWLRLLELHPPSKP